MVPFVYMNILSARILAPEVTNKLWDYKLIYVLLELLSDGS